MEIKDKVVLVTGGAGGIGRALARQLHAEGARGVTVADLDGGGARAVAEELGGLGLEVDVSREEAIREAVARTEERFGPVDLLCSNAGVAYSDAPGWMATSQSNQQWERIWKINVMAHIWGARAVLPGMIRRGGGGLLHTVSAAGLLNQIGDASYSVTKHAALGFAESVAITHGDQGIQVSVVCPQAVETGMFRGAEFSEAAEAASVDGVLQPEDVAAVAIEGLKEGLFLILPHPKVREYFQRKAGDYDRWIGGMRKFRRRLYPDDTPMDLGSE